MRKFWRMIAATMVLAAVLCVGACASDFDAAAEDLSAIGMFRGTGTGFELDRAPTRAEAAIMLVRLYGAEEEAAADYTAGKIQHPFKDVPSFAAPHVAWLYEKELTKGMSADTFGASSACIVRDYTTFLLRALGYQDGTDFAYADAETFADEKGFYDWEIIDWPFTRGNLAALTYQALATDTKDGDTWLLESLVESGAVDAEAAKPMMEKMEHYRTVCAAVEAVDKTAMDVRTEQLLQSRFVQGTEVKTSSVYTVSRIQTKVNGADVQMSYLSTTNTDGYLMDYGFWLKDGYTYTYVGDDAAGYGKKCRAEDPLAEMNEILLMEGPKMDIPRLSRIELVTAEKDEECTVYTVTTRGDTETKSCYVLDQDGGLKELYTELTVYTEGANASINGVDQTQYDAVKFYSQEISVFLASGKNVKVGYFDFSRFVEVEEHMDSES